VTALEQFGGWVASSGGLDEKLRHAVALHLTDAVAAWIAGRRTAEGAALLALPAEDLHGRALCHCACTRLSEIDDIHLASATTPGGVVVPAAVTVAAALGADGAALACATAAGYEAMVRLGRAIDGPAALYRGVWPTYFAAPFAVAATSARLLGLDASRSAHALGIALALAAPGVGRPGGSRTSRWLALGNACASGVRAALWARDGFTADLGLVDGEFLSSVYGVHPDASALTRSLGETNAVAETSFKPWCAARQTMAAAQAWIELFGEGVAPPDLREVRVGVPPPYLKMVNHGVTAGERLSHLTSLPYQLALAALAPDARFDVQQAPATISPTLRGFMEKVKVEPDKSLMAHYPETWPARVTVVTGEGTREKLVLHVPGDPRRPWGEAEVLEKFERYAERGLARAALDGSIAPAALLARVSSG
jgi:2-methylcitrate dehydratase PrpD